MHPGVVAAVVALLFILGVSMYYSSATTEEGFATETQSIGVVSMMKQPKNLDTWLDRHRRLGIVHFYIRLEDSPEDAIFLQQQSDVTLQIGESTGVNEYEMIQRRQETWINEALQLATEEHHVQWLIHIDADEILTGNLDEIRSFSNDVRTFWFQNVEAKFADIPRSEDNCFNASAFANCATEPAKCVSYGNGKSGGRVAADVSSHGPHRMTSSMSEAKEVKLEEVFVEHYESCDFEVYKKKFKALAVQDRSNDIPFSYYNESIEAARNDEDGSAKLLEEVYRKYRVQ